MDQPKLPNIYDYMDYRAFLRDYYHAEKARHRGFSFRAFSQRAGCRSPNYLKLVFDGKRSLTSRMAVAFAGACGLAGEKASYFQDLVAFNQADTLQQRNLHYRSLTTRRAGRKVHRLEASLASYYATWYLPAIRELVCSHDFREDPAWIAGRLIPKISKAQAKRALKDLIESGMLVRDDEGRLRQADPLVSTGPEVRSLHVANFHRAMTQRAMGAIDAVAREERDISSLTLCLSPAGLKLYKARIQRFRRELLELSEAESEPSQVVQLNVQLFPLSRADPEASSSEAPGDIE